MLDRCIAGSACFNPRTVKSIRKVPEYISTMYTISDSTEVHVIHFFSLLLAIVKGYLVKIWYSKFVVGFFFFLRFPKTNTPFTENKFLENTTITHLISVKEHFFLFFYEKTKKTKKSKSKFTISKLYLVTFYSCQ